MLPLAFPLSTCSTHIAHKIEAFFTLPGLSLLRKLCASLVPTLNCYSPDSCQWLWRGDKSYHIILYFTEPRYKTEVIITINKIHHRYYVFAYHSSFKINCKASTVRQEEHHQNIRPEAELLRTFLRLTFFLPDRKRSRWPSSHPQTNSCLQDLYWSLVDSRIWKQHFKFLYSSMTQFLLEAESCSSICECTDSLLSSSIFTHHVQFSTLYADFYKLSL